MREWKLFYLKLITSSRKRFPNHHPLRKARHFEGESSTSVKQGIVRLHGNECFVRTVAFEHAL